MLVDQKRFAHALLDLVRQTRNRLAVAGVSEDDHELVAALPADGVGFANTGREPGDDGLQELVADRVAKRVVDRLEAVKVEEHQGHAAV